MRVLRQQTVTELRSSIDRLPERTRAAMLTGVQAGTMITGAYADRDGGVCPMLAAHRQGARADFVAFAGAWDRFTGVEGWDICRRATPAEVGLPSTAPRRPAEETKGPDLARESIVKDDGRHLILYSWPDDDTG